MTHPILSTMEKLNYQEISHRDPPVPWFGMIYQDAVENGLSDQIFGHCVRLDKSRRPDYIKYLVGMMGFPLSFFGDMAKEIND